MTCAAWKEDRVRNTGLSSLMSLLGHIWKECQFGKTHLEEDGGEGLNCFCLTWFSLYILENGNLEGILLLLLSSLGEEIL